MKEVESADVKFSTQLRPLVLHLESMVKNGHAAEAARVAKRNHKTFPNEMHLLESNVLYETHGSNADEERLSLLNTVYRNNLIQKVVFRNSENGFVFGNIDCKPKVSKSEDLLVSVLVPAYNSEKYIDIMLGSLQRQTWENLEIIIVDDASEDNTWGIIEKNLSQDDRIRAVRNESNMGAYATRNRALKMAKGDYVTVHDSDDWSHPQMVETLASTISNSPVCRGVFGTAVRVNEAMQYKIRPQRPNLERIHRSYPSFMARRCDFVEMGGWDEVNANADDEMVKRFEAKFGKESVVDKVVQAPLTFQLHHEASLTQAEATTIGSLSYGMRRSYSIQAEHWHRTQKETGGSLRLERKGLKDPFPVPQLMVRPYLRRPPVYDLLIISDLSLLGGTRRCNQGYIAAAVKAGLRVGLYHYPRWDFKLKDVAADYFEICKNDQVDLLTKEDKVRASLCIVHHPPILRYSIDQLPSIQCSRLGVLVNQLPAQLRSEQPWMYDPEMIRGACQKYFECDPVWIPISRRVDMYLRDHGCYEPINPRIWHPPHSHGVVESVEPPTGLDNRSIVIGRHSRDHWTKWPSEKKDTMAAYCANEAGIETRFLGGAKGAVSKTAMSAISGKPANWKVYEFDALEVMDFIHGLDVFVNFMHWDYLEEFGRNTMEAMAFGKPVVLEESLRDVFGDSAVYCKPEEVSSVVRGLVTDRERYIKQAEVGVEFVRRNCTLERAAENILEMIASGAGGPPY